MKPGFYNLPAAEYYSDPCDRPSLTQSAAHTLLSRSPMHAYREHPRLGGVPREATPEMHRGTIVHQMILEGTEDLKGIVRISYDDFRSKAAQKLRDEAMEVGLIPILDREYAACILAAGSVKEQLDRLGIVLDGQSEEVAIWEEFTDQGAPVICRGRIDHRTAAGTLVLDFKTCTNGCLRSCIKSILNTGYDIQAAAYLSAVERINPDLAGRVEFLFVFIEMAEPYPVTPIRLDGSFLTLGRMKWRRAVNLWHRCLSSNSWPAYAEAPLLATVPAWAIRDEAELSPYANELLDEVQS